LAGVVQVVERTAPPEFVGLRCSDAGVFRLLDVVVVAMPFEPASQQDRMQRVGTDGGAAQADAELHHRLAGARQDARLRLARERAFGDPTADVGQLVGHGGV
jgi:hypothetical protein